MSELLYELKIMIIVFCVIDIIALISISVSQQIREIENMNKTAWRIKKQYNTSWKTAYGISYRAYRNRYVNAIYELILIGLVALTFI